MAAKDFLFLKDKEIRGFPHADVQAIRESIKPLSIRLSEVEKELAAAKSQTMNVVRRAQGMIAKKKREETDKLAHTLVEKEELKNTQLRKKRGIVRNSGVCSIEGNGNLSKLYQLKQRKSINKHLWDELETFIEGHVETEEKTTKRCI